MIHTYYHASRTKLKETLLHPRVPKNRLTDSGKEENTTPRVCVSQSMPEAIMASGRVDLGKHHRVYIYECQADTCDVVQPTRKQVYDSYITGELWIMKPVEMKLLTILHISDITDVDRQRSCHIYQFEDKESSGMHSFREYAYVDDPKNTWWHKPAYKKFKGKRAYIGYHYDILVNVNNLSIILNDDNLLGYSYSMSGTGESFTLTLTKDDHKLIAKTGDTIQSWLMYNNPEDARCGYNRYLDVCHKE